MLILLMKFSINKELKNVFKLNNTIKSERERKGEGEGGREREKDL
jgi:hypothetical protein